MLDIKYYYQLNNELDIYKHEISWCKDIMNKITRDSTKKKLVEYAGKIKSYYDGVLDEQKAIRSEIIDRLFKIDNDLYRKILLSRYIDHVPYSVIASEYGLNKSEYRLACNQAIKLYKVVDIGD